MPTARGATAYSHFFHLERGKVESAKRQSEEGHTMSRLLATASSHRKVRSSPAASAVRAVTEIRKKKRSNKGMFEVDDTVCGTENHENGCNHASDRLVRTSHISFSFHSRDRGSVQLVLSARPVTRGFPLVARVVAWRMKPHAFGAAISLPQYTSSAPPGGRRGAKWRSLASKKRAAFRYSESRTSH